MNNPVTLQLDLPIDMVDILTEEDLVHQQELADLRRQCQDIRAEVDAEKGKLTQAVQAVRAAAEELVRCREELLEEFQRDVVSLSMEVAEKVLRRQIDKGEYNIDDILGDALSQIPHRGEIVVRLNPDDYQQSECVVGHATFNGATVKYLADPGVSPAGCVVESCEGLVDASVEAALEEIEDALDEETDA